jgi:hypothetical protein
MADELVGPVGCGQDGDRDQAPVAGRQAGAFPDVPEQDVVGELDHLGREVAEQPLGGSLLFSHGGFLFSLPAHEDLCWALARRVRAGPSRDHLSAVPPAPAETRSYAQTARSTF